MANGDISHEDIEQFIEIGTLDTTQANAVDQICNGINSDVNLVLRRLGISLPVTDNDSLEWLELTKKLGAASLSVDYLMGQDSEEENTRSQRYWDKYLARIRELIESGGDILEADFQTDPRPLNVPVSVFDSQASLEKKSMRFPQRAAAEHYEDDLVVRRSRQGYKRAIRGL